MKRVAILGAWLALVAQAGAAAIDEPSPGRVLTLPGACQTRLTREAPWQRLQLGEPKVVVGQRIRCGQPGLMRLVLPGSGHEAKFRLEPDVEYVVPLGQRLPNTNLTPAARIAGIEDEAGVLPEAGSERAGVVARSPIERCEQPLGTLVLDDDPASTTNVELRNRQLGPPTPWLRQLAVASNCFVVVELGDSLRNAMRERQLLSGAGGRALPPSVAALATAEFVLRPGVEFSDRRPGLGGILGGLTGGGLGVTGSLAVRDATTTLLLLDTGSGVQVTAAEGSGRGVDTASLLAEPAFAGSSYLATPQGKVVASAFIESYNQTVRALRNYKAQRAGRADPAGAKPPNPSASASAPAPRPPAASGPAGE